MSPLAAPLKFVAGLALPPRCPGCAAVTGADHRFCATCWGALRFLAPPWCATCQMPFEHAGISDQCADCRAQPPRHAGVFAAVAYGDIARTVALRLKYGGRIAFAETVGRQMARLMPPGADLILPVPLHRWRLWSRGFNQAALIAASVARASGVATDPLVLRRTRATPMLRGLGVTARERAVKGAFAVSPRARVADKAIVLVDDIYTSGATTDACTDTLLAAGARSVAILCWARVLDSAASD
ncbi:ComF family protein [Sphingomonas sp. NFR15]|uniref:ComF family protein n=1 Tax=Sphingomonas sp. NFR15 TaxID=1566282 RepID=UPI000AA34156|nr:ComF family protein [Sphingomonas sp. NFR15]